jgi:hypothetical protein
VGKKMGDDLGLKEREDPTSVIMCTNLEHWKPNNKLVTNIAR